MSIVKFNIEISNKLILIRGILIIEIGNMTSSIYENVMQNISLILFLIVSN
jgi:hypothetical protein